jgi:hypothetical protein
VAGLEEIAEDQPQEVRRQMAHVTSLRYRRLLLPQQIRLKRRK